MSDSELPNPKRRKTDYSDNKHTIKNREAMKKLSGEALQRKKDKVSDNTAYSRFYNQKFLKNNTVIQILAGETDLARRGELSQALHVQSNNAALKLRYMGLVIVFVIVLTNYSFAENKHWTQRAATRCPDETFPTQDSFYKQQSQIFELPTEFMPPKTITTITTTAPAAPSSTTSTNLGVVVYEDPHNIIVRGEDANAVDLDMLDVDADEAELDKKAILTVQTMQHWRHVQEVWAKALQLISNKLKCLNKRSFEFYVRRMNHRTLRVTMLLL